MTKPWVRGRVSSPAVILMVAGWAGVGALLLASLVADAPVGAMYLPMISTVALAATAVALVLGLHRRCDERVNRALRSRTPDPGATDAPPSVAPQEKSSPH